MIQRRILSQDLWLGNQAFQMKLYQMFTTRVDTLMFHGSGPHGFEAVENDFRKNFTEQGEVVGAALQYSTTVAC